MLYIVEDTVYCMQISHERGTLYNNLRYGIARDSLRTTEIYNCRYRNRVRQTYKNIKRYRILIIPLDPNIQYLDPLKNIVIVSYGFLELFCLNSDKEAFHCFEL